MKRFVLIRKGQEVVSGARAAEMVTASGFAAAAKKLGVGDSTLRKFLQDEGFRFSRHTSWQVEALPGLEASDGDHGDDHDGGGVQAPVAGSPEPAGAGV